MANENPIPANPGLTDATPLPLIEVLLAGDLADDDPLWVVRCDPNQLAQIVRDPDAWVTALAGLPGWVEYGTTTPAPTPILTPDFSMVVRMDAVADPTGRIVVSGISKTNVLNVVLGPSSLAAVIPDVAAFWTEVAADPSLPGGTKPLPIRVAGSASTFFAHFEVIQRPYTAQQRADRIARYLLAAALDPTGHAAMLSGLRQDLIVVGALSVAQDRSQAEAPSGVGPVVFAAAPGTGLVYANVEGAGADDDEEASCSAIMGTYTPGSGTIGATTVKRYGGNATDAPTG